jgi:hypothetical protein
VAVVASQRAKPGLVSSPRAVVDVVVAWHGAEGDRGVRRLVDLAVNEVGAPGAQRRAVEG